MDELSRNAKHVDRNSDWIEQTHAAHNASKERRKIASSRMRLKSKAIQTAVTYLMIKRRWTPERISGYLKKNHLEHYICDESIYQWIYAERKDFGHWEGDLIEGSRRSSSREVVLSLLERKSRFSVYVKLPNKESLTIYEALKAFFEDLPQSLRQSLTLDNGVENALHYRLSRELNMQVYFCHSYASYEKGQVENSNRNFRKFVPKSLCLSLVDDFEIHKAEHYRNTLPMKCLGFDTPRRQFFAALTAVAH